MFADLWVILKENLIFEKTMKRTNQPLNLGKSPRKNEATFSTSVRQDKTNTFGPQKFISHQGLSNKFETKKWLEGHGHYEDR